MKFARLLRTTAEDLPELQCLFHIYKHLKKQLKQLPARSESKPPGADAQTPNGRTPDDAPGDAAGVAQLGVRAAAGEANEEERFTAVLTDHLQRLNDRFLEREETCVIQLERLEAEAAQCTLAVKAAAAAAGGAGTSDGRTGEGGDGTGHLTTMKAITDQRAQLYKRFVNFHGEVLLLVHWSVLAYTATVKILKKHHKRTGLLLRAPQLGDLLSQPFCSSELMTSLARKAEVFIQLLAEQLAASGTSGGTTDVTADGVAGPGRAVGGGGGGGGGPQDTVNQAEALARHAAAALGTAAAVADEDSYGVADGSSPSCSQSPGDLMIRRVGAVEQPQPAVGATGAQPAGAEETPMQQRVQLRGRQDQQPQEEREARDAATGLPGRGNDGGGSGAGGGVGSAGAGAGAIGGGGVTFLRNLTRMSDNSAASLSGPYVLEQLAELQHFVDKYDKMDDDDLDDLEEEEDSGAVGVGGATAAAAAAVHGGHQQSTPPPQQLAGRADATATGPRGQAVATSGGAQGGGGGTAADPGTGAGPSGRACPAGAPGSALLQEQPQVGMLGQAQQPPSSGGSDVLRRDPLAGSEPPGAASLQRHPHQLQHPLCMAAKGEDPSGDAACADALTRPLTAQQAPHQSVAPNPPPQQHPTPRPHHLQSGDINPTEPPHRQAQLLQLPAAQQQHLQSQSLQPQHQPQELAGLPLPWGPAAWGPSSGSGSGSGSAPTAGGQPGGQLRIGAVPPQSSSGSAAATAGGGGGGGSMSVALSDSVFAGLTGMHPMGGRPPLEAGGANLLRRTQVALTMWEQLRANASTPSTVIDPAAGQMGPGPAGGGVKRRRQEGGLEGEEVESVGDDSGSNSED